MKLVTKEEIEHVARLMRIEMDDHTIHTDRVQKMIEYFGILDRAGIEEEELAARDMPIEGLREDVHRTFEGDVLSSLKTYKKRHVRAPKMV